MHGFVCNFTIDFYFCCAVASPHSRNVINVLRRLVLHNLPDLYARKNSYEQQQNNNAFHLHCSFPSPCWLAKSLSFSILAAVALFCFFFCVRQKKIKRIHKMLQFSQKRKKIKKTATKNRWCPRSIKAHHRSRSKQDDDDNDSNRRKDAVELRSFFLLVSFPFFPSRPGPDTRNNRTRHVGATLILLRLAPPCGRKKLHGEREVLMENKTSAAKP